MRILLLSQFFDPEPTLKGLAFAKALVQCGHQVEVLTGFPNYPGGKVYPGYKVRLYRREVMDGITVHRVALYASHDRSAAKRVLNYVSFAAFASLIGPWVVGKVDAMYVHHPPITISWPARVLRLLKRAPFIYEIQDLWPDTLLATGMMSSRRLLDFIGRWAKRVYRKADHIVVISPGFRRQLLGRGVPAERVDVLYNWCEEGRLRPAPRDPALAKELGLADRFNVMFAGTMGLAQGLDTVLDGAALVAKKDPKLQFVFVGGGVDEERLKVRAAEQGLENVLFLPRQPIERMGKILPLADVLLVHLRDDPLFAITVPSKTQAYLACGLPILMAVRGDAADLVQAAEAGEVCEPQNPDSLAEAALGMALLPQAERNRMGARGRQFYERKLAMAVGVKKYDKLFRKLAGGS